MEIGEKLKGWLEPIWGRPKSPDSSEKPIWSGIYESFDQVPIVGPGFEGRGFAEQAQMHTRALLTTSETRQTIPVQTSCQNSLLPLLASLVSEKTGKVGILDFGGGTGTAFVHLINSVPSSLNVKYEVVETQSTCELGEELFAGDSRIRFLSSLEDVGPIDIVHISSALQYVKDYRKMLIDLCSFKAPYFLLANLSAANIPTYATAQHVYDGMVVPYWFLDVDEVIEILASESYRLLWKSSVDRTYDQADFPPEYRMVRACNLLFHQDAKCN